MFQNWLVEVDVDSSIEQLVELLKECISIFPCQQTQNYNLFYCSQNHLDVIKVNLTLKGYCISEADINIKLSSRHPSQTIKTCIKEIKPKDNSMNIMQVGWVLHQIQDAINHLGNATDLLTKTPLRMGPDNKHDFQSPEEVLFLIESVMNCLQKSRTSLLIPNKRVIEELQHSRNMQSIKPPLPIDYSISFYIQAQNLICSVYHLSQNNLGPLIKAEYQAELPIGFLSEALINLSIAQQTCQQLKDKLESFVHIV